MPKIPNQKLRLQLSKKPSKLLKHDLETRKVKSFLEKSVTSFASKVIHNGAWYDTRIRASSREILIEKFGE